MTPSVDDIREYLYDEYGVAVSWNLVIGTVYVRFNNPPQVDRHPLSKIKNYLEAKRALFGKPMKNKLFKGFKRIERNE